MTVKSNPVRAITIWQPWASLVAVGAKRVETRTWRPNIKTPFTLAIHASKRWNNELADLAARGAGIADACRTRGLDANALSIARGKLLCTVEVAQVVPMNSFVGKHVDEWPEPMRCEILLGDYGCNRFAWVFKKGSLTPLDPTIPAVGQQGIWVAEIREVTTCA